ncbi:MAG TPA: hypothetical protein VIJ01_08355 [Candidatus Angelobacter sp.]
MLENSDRLYNLLPVYIRQRDVIAGQPLRALLQVVSEQVNQLESDVQQLYENWFIETCEDWVVPYIGELVGYQLPPQAALTGAATDGPGQRRRVLSPRRDVANVISYRQRKGTLALLEQLAHDLAGWPARAVEFGRLLDVTQSMHHLRSERGKSVSVRQVEALELLGSPFDLLSHSVDVHRIDSMYRRGRYSIPNIGVFVFRLQPYTVTRAEARCMEEEDNAGGNCFTFSPLGNDTALFCSPEAESAPRRFSGELNLPTAIRRRAFEEHLSERPHNIASARYYGEGKSITLWDGRQAMAPISRELIIPADLTRWHYSPPSGYVAIDPELGRICFHPGEEPEDVIVSYSYGFSDEIGGGEYPRPEFALQNERLYTVDSGGAEARGLLRKALEQWKAERPKRAVIEITDSQTYSEDRLPIELAPGQFLEFRARQGTRPIVRITDSESGRAESLSISGSGGGTCIFDGVTLTGRGIQVKGGVEEVIFRHSTLVPGWGLHHDCRPRHAGEPSILLFNSSARVTIEHSIVGGIRCEQRERKNEPNVVRITDSILDATDLTAEAVWSEETFAAFIKLTIARSTVIGKMLLHQVELAENCIFTGEVTVARRQSGCFRFCYVPPHSITPRRYHCQPDLAISAHDALNRAAAEMSVAPVFSSTRYGNPTYCQLAESCPNEIRSGADDESEMGVFHNLFQPQRYAGLRTRLEEYVPAGSQVGIIFAS